MHEKINHNLQNCKEGAKINKKNKCENKSEIALAFQSFKQN